MADCGEKWDDVGQKGVTSLFFTVKMGQYEQLFYFW